MGISLCGDAAAFWWVGLDSRCTSGSWSWSWQLGVEELGASMSVNDQKYHVTEHTLFGRRE
jgi:hypothetical protein